MSDMLWAVQKFQTNFFPLGHDLTEDTPSPGNIQQLPVLH